ncbi:nucleotidyltransferase family protein [candidate division KSB1 bacterium]|nr:nucleotidyltransferase family protein [candidate division KSB1 bacterium]
MIQSKNDIFFLIKKNQHKIKSFGVKKLGLFGSFCRQEQNSDSDVDFLVDFEGDKKTFDNFINLSFFLEELMSRKIELVTPESISPYFKTTILNEVEYVSFN